MLLLSISNKKKQKRLLMVNSILMLLLSKGLLLIVLAQFIQVNGKVVFAMVMVRWFGLITQGTKVSGNIIKHVEKENFSTQMETLMMVNGVTTKQMDTVSI
jgi:hypothetical protein